MYFIHSLIGRSFYIFKTYCAGELIDYFSQKSELDLRPLFDLYLYYPDVPILEYSYDSLSASMRYKWQDHLNEEYPLWVTMTDGQYKTKLTPSTSWQTTDVSERPSFDIADFGYVLVKDVDND